MSTQLRYGHFSTYTYELDSAQLNWLTDQTNRSNSQTMWLFQLVEGDWEALKAYEEKTKNTWSGCAGTKSELERVMALEVSNPWFKLTDDEPDLNLL